MKRDKEKNMKIVRTLWAGVFAGTVETGDGEEEE